MQVLKRLHYICFKVALKTPVSMAIALDAAMRDKTTKIETFGCLRVDPAIIWLKSSLIIPTPYIYSIALIAQLTYNNLEGELAT